jgi:dTDP-4-dehydrorhamnose 3,5-epimerase
MADVKVIDGEIFRDQRGQISSLNAFRFPGVERFYFIHHPDTSVIRGWHGHQHEKKWFYCVKGAFTIGLVEIDDWETPSPELKAQKFHLTEQESKIICVPEGYANCIKASVPGSILLVFSGKTLPEAYSDSWRYDSKLWITWSENE